MLHEDATHLGSLEHAPCAAEFFEIRIETRPLPIRIEYAAIRSLHSSVAAQDHSLGLLLGTFTSNALSVDHCESLPLEAAGAEGFTKAQSMHPAERVVGFFRTQPGGWPEMQKADRDIGTRCFQHPGSLFLLIQTPGHRPWSAALFELEAECESSTTTPALEFLFDEYLLRNGYSTALVAGPEQQALGDPPLARWRSHWVALSVFGAVLLLAVAGYQWFAGQDQDRGETASVASAASPLVLKVVRSGPDLEVSWDHHAPGLRTASGGRLTIRDGDVTRTVPLNSAQLRGGRVLYTPLFSELNFRLEIEQGARTQAESVQVVLWDTSSASEFPANLPPISAVPSLFGSPSSALRPWPGRRAADVQPSSITGKPHTPALPSTSTPLDQAVSPRVSSTSVSLTPQAMTSPASSQESSQAKPLTILPAPSPAAAAVTTVSELFSSLYKPTEVKSTSLPPVPATSTGAASSGSAPGAEKPAISPKSAASPVPTPAAPNDSNAPVSVLRSDFARTQSSAPNYVPPVVVARALPKVTPEVKRVLNLVHGQVKLSVRVTVDVDGEVRNVAVLPQGDTSTSVDFFIVKSAALDAAKHWKFRPAVLDGKVVPSDVTIEFNFR